jgi:hypothetical protein
MVLEWKVEAGKEPHILSYLELVDKVNVVGRVWLGLVPELSVLLIWKFGKLATLGSSVRALCTSSAIAAVMATLTKTRELNPFPNGWVRMSFVSSSLLGKALPSLRNW